MRAPTRPTSGAGGTKTSLEDEACRPSPQPAKTIIKEANKRIGTDIALAFITAHVLRILVANEQFPLLPVARTSSPWRRSRMVTAMVVECQPSFVLHVRKLHWASSPLRSSRMKNASHQ